MTEAMEALQQALFVDKVPELWFKVAFPSERPLGQWSAQLTRRIAQLQDWTAAPSDIPMVTWIGGLFNPKSFFTAIMQVTAQAQRLELDKLSVATEVTKKMDAADISDHSRDGAFVC